MRGDRLAMFVGIITSLVTLIISTLELPSDPSSFNLWLALSVSVSIVMLLAGYALMSSRHVKERKREETRVTQEEHLRIEFPEIFAFIENISEIRSKQDFDQFIARLNHLLELERRSRSIKWSEVKDIEAMKAIAYAKLVAKKADDLKN